MPARHLSPLSIAEIRHILFVQFGGIGDVVLAFPAIQSLREAYPAARIVLLVEPRARGVEGLNPAIDEVLTFEAKGSPALSEFLDLIGKLRTFYFDLAIASGKNPAIPALLWLSGARYRVGYAANRLKFLLTLAVKLEAKQYAAWMYYDLVRPFLDIPARLPQVVVAPEDQAWATGFLARHASREGEWVAVLHPGASKIAVKRGIHKTWEAARWAHLAQALVRRGLQVVLAGGPDDAETIGVIMSALEGAPDTGKIIVAHGQTRTLGQLAALIQRATLLVAVDSAPMHLGVAVGTVTIGLFGPTDPTRLLPTGTGHQAVHVLDLPCRPCLWEHRVTTCHDLTCLGDLSVEMVLAAVWRALPTTLPVANANRS